MKIEIQLAVADSIEASASRALFDCLASLSNLSQLSDDYFGPHPQTGERLEVFIGLSRNNGGPRLSIALGARDASSVIFDFEVPSNLPTQHGRDDGCSSAHVPIGLAAFMQRAGGRLRRLDHAGMSIDSSLVPRQIRRRLASMLKSCGAAYVYPGQPKWLFLLSLPQQTAIGNRLAGPNFELVCEVLGAGPPTVQLDILTSLSRPEAERLFPDPIGSAPPALADYFRSIYVDMGWTNAHLRLDLRFAPSTPEATLTSWLLTHATPVTSSTSLDGWD